MKNVHPVSSMRRWDSKPGPLEHESPPITTRPGLPPNTCCCWSFLLLLLPPLSRPLCKKIILILSSFKLTLSGVFHLFLFWLWGQPFSQNEMVQPEKITSNSIKGKSPSSQSDQKTNPAIFFSRVARAVENICKMSTDEGGGIKSNFGLRMKLYSS